MRNMLKKATGLILAAALTFSLAAPAAAAGSSSAAGASSGAVTETALPQQGWQAQVTFPDWAGYVDDTLAMNSLYSFDGYADQGELYVTLASGVTSLRLFVNNAEVDTSAMKGGSTYKVDISDLTVNGTNTVQVSAITPSTLEGAVTVSIPYPTVITGLPSDVGMDEGVLGIIDDFIVSEVKYGFSGAQLAVVKDGKLVYSNAWGTVNAYNPDGTPKADSPAVTTDTLYDLASNTKMYATNYAIQYLVANSKNYNNFSINDPITKYFPDFVNSTIEIKYDTANGTGAPDLETAKAWKAELTVADILQHQAGFAPDPQFHNDKFDQVTQTPDPDTDNVLYAIGKDAVAEAICKAPLVYEPGTKTVYSDVDYMLLGLIVEQVTGKDLNTFLKETFWQPLGLTHITYNPLDNGFTANDCAATELNGNSRDGAIDFTGNRTGTIQGQVHDEKTWYAMGGVSGHAGLFANAEDLATLAQMMLNPSGYGSNRLFSTNVNEYFTSRKNSSATWGQGWWRQADCGRPWYFGVQASRNTIGHQGWTGTLTVIDPEQDLIVVYLTNKINSPVTDNTVNANQFDGNWYTASTLGFVTNILYQGITANSAAGDIQPALDALLGDMAMDKLRLAAAEDLEDADHPLMRAANSIAELAYEASYARPTDANKAMVLQLADALRQLSDVGTYDRMVRVMSYNIHFGQSSRMCTTSSPSPM